MPQAPNRGARKCGTCAMYTDKQEEWEKECKLDVCECKVTQRKYGRATCKNYKSRRYIDMSGHSDIGGPATGVCEWKCPPVMRKLLWSQMQYQLVNRDVSWCHCWEPMPEVKMIDENSALTATSPHLAIPETETRWKLPGLKKSSS